MVKGKAMQLKHGKSRLRLLIIPNSLSTFGGGEHLALELAKMFKNKYDVKLIDPISKKDVIRRDKHKLLEEFGIEESSVTTVECSSIQAKAFNTEGYLLMMPKIKGIRHLSNAIKNSDVIYCITNNPLLLGYSVFFANKFDSRLILAVQNRIFSSYFEKGMGLKDRISISLYKTVLKQIRYFHALNSFDLKLIKENIPKAKVYLVPGFTQIENRAVRANNKRFRVVFVGRLPKHQKGIDLLYSIVEKTLASNDKIEFKIIGAGGDGEPLVDELARRYPKNVGRPGFLPYNEVKGEYKEANLLIFTSRGEELRYFPLVFLEGQSFGLPIITFSGRGYDSILLSKVQGVSVKPFDTDKFSNELLRYYRMWKRDKKGYLQVKRRIHKIVKENFNEEVVLSKMSEMFKDAALAQKVQA